MIPEDTWPFKTSLLTAALALGLTGCATSGSSSSPAYAAKSAPSDSYRTATKLEQVKAQCELVADGLQTQGFAFGSPSFVGGYAVGSAIQGMIDHASRYDHCMTLYGYVRAQ